MNTLYLFTIPLAFSIVATAMSATFIPPAGEMEPMNPSTRMPVSPSVNQNEISSNTSITFNEN